MDEIRKYFRFEDQLHPHGYENKEQLLRSTSQSSCWLKHFYMKNTFRALFNVFFWEIFRLSQYTHFYYRLGEAAGAEDDDMPPDHKTYCSTGGEHKLLLRHFSFVSKQRSSSSRLLATDYDLYRFLPQAVHMQPGLECSSRIVVVGQGAQLSYFLNNLVLRYRQLTWPTNCRLTSAAAVDCGLIVDIQM